MEKKLEQITDIEFALALAFHIDNPCSTQVGEKTESIRDFYIREAQRFLPKMENFGARYLLQSKIDNYLSTQSSR